MLPKTFWMFLTNSCKTFSAIFLSCDDILQNFQQISQNLTGFLKLHVELEIQQFFEIFCILPSTDTFSILPQFSVVKVELISN